MTDFPIVLFHYPQCGTSRFAKSALEASGLPFDVVEYSKVGWTRPLLQSLLASMGAKPSDVLRRVRSPAEDMGLLEEGVTEAQIFDAMLSEPMLVNRPIVVTPKGTKLCRPKTSVYDVLPDDVTKIDG